MIYIHSCTYNFKGERETSRKRTIETGKERKGGHNGDRKDEGICGRGVRQSVIGLGREWKDKERRVRSD